MLKRNSIKNIEFKDLTLITESGRIIFHKVNLEVPMGKIIWVKGPVSAGKTLFIRLLGSLVQPTLGSCWVNGENITEMTFEEFLPYRLNIGYSFDFGGLINNRTLYGNLSLPLEYHRFGTPKDISQHLMRYLKVFDLENVAGERPSAVAGGYRKAVCVGRAFVHDPELLLLDDPTTGLRGKSKENLKNLILENFERGINRHIFVATEDEAFMQSLKAETIDISNYIESQKRAEAA